MGQYNAVCGEIGWECVGVWHKRLAPNPSFHVRRVIIRHEVVLTELNGEAGFSCVRRAAV